MLCGFITHGFQTCFSSVRFKLCYQTYCKISVNLSDSNLKCTPIKVSLIETNSPSSSSSSWHSSSYSSSSMSGSDLLSVLSSRLHHEHQLTQWIIDTGWLGFGLQVHYGRWFTLNFILLSLCTSQMEPDDDLWPSCIGIFPSFLASLNPTGGSSNCVRRI